MNPDTFGMWCFSIGIGLVSIAGGIWVFVKLFRNLLHGDKL